MRYARIVRIEWDGDTVQTLGDTVIEDAITHYLNSKGYAAMFVVSGEPSFIVEPKNE